ncbi:MAG: DUF4625 domain-containing protein [Bacteroidetes bacterium]|nr:DUF4625 domain-containing protein [Bacteroidota bacterium]
MKQNIFGIALLAVLPLLPACQKENGPQEDTEAPVISLSSPSTGAVYASGDPIPVVFRITENDELHTWDIELRRASDQSLLTSTGEHDHATVLDINANISASVGEPTNCLVRIIAEDHNGNTAEREVAIRIDP